MIQAATSLAPFDEALKELLAILLLTGATAVAGSLGVGYLLARKALAPVDRMVSEAAEITVTRLDRRLEITCAGDELGRLGRTLNDMIERLEQPPSRRVDGSSPRTPRTASFVRRLPIIRSSAEVARRVAAARPSRIVRVAEEVVEESERLGRLVAQLLALCREDHGPITASDRVIRIDELTYDVAELMQIAAVEKGVTLSAGELSPACVRGDADRLRQLLINVLDNAIKYTPSGGSVSVKGSAAAGRVVIEVIDIGAGIPAEHLQDVFERFYRVDASRSRGIDGTGLGLALCRSIAEAHQGRIWIASELGRGTKVSLELPCWDVDPDDRHQHGLRDRFSGLVHPVSDVSTGPRSQDFPNSEQPNRQKRPRDPETELQPMRRRLRDVDVESDRLIVGEILHEDVDVPSAGLG